VFILLAFQFMATVHTEPDGRRVLYVKGAPDRLMPLCKSQLTGAGDVTQTAPLDPSFWQHAQAGLSSKGLRVLALCRCGDIGLHVGGGFRLAHVVASEEWPARMSYERIEL
jgi:magnesium-transporting ATPase (P-type)